MSVQWVPSLMFVTLCAAAGFGVLQLFFFMQRRSNADIAENALVGSDTPQATRHGAGAFWEIAGGGALAVVVMALLVFGYNGRNHSPAMSTATESSPTTATGSSASTPATATDQMSGPTQNRSNPAEMSNPPTQYPQGSGSATTGETGK